MAVDRRRNLGLPSGVVFPFAGATAPYGYLICDGRAVSRTDYAQLFSAIGTAHGVGDGSTTFNLPDYRGNFLRGEVNISTITGSGTVASNNATFTNHGVNRTGFKVRLSSGTLSGLSTSTDYYAIVVDSNTLAFASSLANAIAGTKLAISGANSAVLAQWEDPDKASRFSKIQEDALQNITISGSFYAASISAATSGVFSATGSAIGNHDLHTSYVNGQTKPYVFSYDASSTNRTSTETRSKNVTVNYIIKI